MSVERTPSTSREDHLHMILHSYLQAVDAGQPRPREELLRQHPELAAELAAFFAEQDRLDQLAHAMGGQGAGTPTLPPGQTAPPIPGMTLRYFGDYELLEELARGGMGVVYKARQVSLNRIVALKMILAGQLASAAEVRRFRTEAEAAANLDHPNIVPIYEVGEHEGQHYFTMKLIDGGSLDRQIGAFTQDPRAAAQVLTTVARAVHHAHQRGILHRDLKPGNILLDAGWQPHVTDFGLAKRVQSESGQTQSGAIVGTPSYMAPEQARAEKGLTIAADVYSLGAILYELLTGQPPFRAETPLEILLHVLDQEPLPPRVLVAGVNRDLETICLKCLEKPAARRYESAADLADDLERWRTGEPIQARAATRRERLVKWVKRRPAAATMVAVCVAAAATLFTGGVVYNARLHVLQAAAAEANRQANEQYALAENTSVEAEALRQAALRDKRQAEQRLAQVLVADGFRSLEREDWQSAVSLFAEALRVDPHDPRRREAHRDRLEAYLRRYPRLVQVIGHESGVLRTVFSPDGQRVLTACADGKARSWEVATGEAATAPLQHEQWITHVAFRPDGQQVLTASGDNTARRWDPSTGRELTPRLRHDDTVFLAEYSPDGRHILTASADGTARLWNAATGGDRGIRLVHAHKVRCAAFSPNGRHVVTGSDDQTARLWDARTGEALVEPLRHGGGVRAATFSPDGKHLATASEDTTARLWDLTGKEICPPLSHRDIVTVAVFSPDGRLVLTASDDKTARLWDAATGKAMGEPFQHAGGIAHAVFSPDGRRILTSCQDGTARLWDAATGRELALPFRHDHRVNHAAFSSDGLHVATASDDRTLQVWYLAADRPPRLPVRLSGLIDQLPTSFSPDGRRLAVIAWNPQTSKYETRITDVATGEPAFAALAHEHSVHTTEFSSDGRRLVTVSRNAKLMESEFRVWDAADGQPLGPPWKQKGSVTLSQLSHDGSRLLIEAQLVQGKNELCVWDVSAGQPAFEPLVFEGPAPLARFSPDGQSVLIAGPGFTVRLREAATGTLRPVELPHEGLVSHAVFSPDGRRLLTVQKGTTQQGEARVWDLASGKPIFPPLKYDGEVISAEVQPDGRWLLALVQDRALRVVDAVSGRSILSLPRSHAVASNILLGSSHLFSADGQRAVTIRSMGSNPLESRPGSEIKRKDVFDHRLQIWDTTTGQPMTPPLHCPMPVLGAALTPDGGHLVVQGADGTVEIWDLTFPDRPLEGIQMLTRIITRSRLDETNSLVPLSLEELRATARNLQARYPTLSAVPSVEARRAWHWYEAADCQLRKHWFAARWHLERLLNLPASPTGPPGPGRAELLSRLGIALYRTGHFEAVLQRLDEARQARGEGFTPNERLYLAMAHHHLGHAAEARQWLDRTKELFEKAQGRELEVADRAHLAQSVLFEWQSTSELFLEAMSLLSGKATQPKP